jgi:hypothetical protein
VRRALRVAALALKLGLLLVADAAAEITWRYGPWEK